MAQAPTPEGPGGVDLRLDWRASADDGPVLARDADGFVESVSVDEASTLTAGGVDDALTAEPVVPAASESVSAASIVAAQARDAFEAAEERVKAIEAAFDVLSEEPLSVAGEQLRRIRRAVAGDALSPTDVASFVREVQTYLEARLGEVRARPLYDHDRMREGRARLEEGLGLYLEICPLIDRWATSRETALGDLIERLEAAAARALQQARDCYASAVPASPP